MGRITVDLLRRRAEHNDRCLSTLQEIGLHAQGIQRLELLNQQCRELRILLLQNNLIAKIEGLHRLKVGNLLLVLRSCWAPALPACFCLLPSPARDSLPPALLSPAGAGALKPGIEQHHSGAEPAALREPASPRPHRQLCGPAGAAQPAQAGSCVAQPTCSGLPTACLSYFETAWCLPHACGRPAVAMTGLRPST